MRIYQKIDGWLNIYKPTGLSSAKVVAMIKKMLQAKKVGHAGTLDPLATGILPIAMGEATKTISFAMNKEKTYLFDICWGMQKDTDDADGKTISISKTYSSEEHIQKALKSFHGWIKQTPPLFSAVKIKGKRACDLMRKEGEINLNLKERDVFIKDVQLLKMINPPSNAISNKLLQRVLYSFFLRGIWRKN